MEKGIRVLSINITLALTAVIFLLPCMVFAHGGGLDKNGGHNDRKRGGYHCHREPCYENQLKTETETLNAISEARSFSHIYRREDWKHWTDVDGDCMNTRHEILQAQADGPIKLSENQCYVSSGIWIDPFSGQRLTLASDLDVDHAIPLKWASDHGGGAWTAAKKEQFANDPMNLLAVDDGLNQAKGAKGPSQWMPPNQGFHCEYLGIWRSTLAEYPTLMMTTAEQQIFNGLLESCTE